jgi:hypothetical protein
MLCSVEVATINVAKNKTDFGYYIPGMVMKFWVAGPTSDYLRQLRAQYEQALSAARRAEADSTPEKRCTRATGSVVWNLRSGLQRRSRRFSAATAVAAQNPPESRRETQRALLKLSRATEAYVRVARTRSEVGAIAALNAWDYSCSADVLV